ncbi:MAG: RIO1 family regulatory kinase/ATPase [Lutispora sp.]|jgi:tRNA A-37 threonylcarbamoyl transferase component Bud32|uniref:RIO1 family regulatory kinase/ATPase domain-containing protein n=1 Tax=Lutispora sp. TaxID=2828727 RepID=UPI003563A25D
MDIEILERLHSKRNQVYKVRYNDGSDKLGVMKKYDSNNHKLLETEYENMKKLLDHGISIPRVIYKDSRCLITEYIHGYLVNDLVEMLDMGDWIDKLALWMASFHKIAGLKGNLLKGDVNLRNFIYSQGNIYGLDFEDLDYGEPRRDLANICFFILTNKPSFTREKHMMIRAFLNSYEKYSENKLESMGRYLLWSREEAKRRRAVKILE